MYIRVCVNIPSSTSSFCFSLRNRVIKARRLIRLTFALLPTVSCLNETVHRQFYAINGLLMHKCHYSVDILDRNGGIFLP